MWGVGLGLCVQGRQARSRCAQTMAIKQMLRKFPVNSRLKKLHGPFAYLFGTGGPTCDAKG